MIDDTAKYKDIFFSEAEEKIGVLNSALLSLEKEPGNSQFVSEAMRAAHTLKSSAAAMEYNQISHLVHAMEDLFESVRSQKTKIEPRTIDILFQCVDVLSSSIASLKKGGKEIDTKALVETLAKGGMTKQDQPSPQVLEPLEKIKVDVSTLDILMNLTEELLVERMRLTQIVRVAKEKSDEKLDISELASRSDAIDRLISELQVNVTKARMVPLGQIFERFPRMVRDLAHEQGKDVDITIAGQEIELDRTVIDRLGEPLIHLLRNAVDHGIEKKGTIALSAERQRDSVTVTVHNTGIPIDWERVVDVAVNKGIIDQKTRDSHIHDTNLLYQLSTKEVVSETSGRGVGLGIVKSVIESLGGSVTIIAKEHGSSFILTLPLTLAIIQALLVRVADQTYALPFSQIDRSERVPRQNIKYAFDQEVAVIVNEDIPMMRLDRLFNIEKKHRGIFLSEKEIAQGKNTQKSELMVITKGSPAGGGQTAIVVDEMISEQDIVVKPLKGMLRQTKGVAGITLLGDGRPAMILDVATLLSLD